METQPVVTQSPASPLSPSRAMRKKFVREVRSLGLGTHPSPTTNVTLSDIAQLPSTVRRYLRFMGVVGRPRTWSFRAHWGGVFRMRPDQPWLPCEAWQYNTSHGIARIFHMRLRFGGLVPVYVRDTYVNGHGRMLGRLLDTIKVVDEADYKIDTGELVTYLNDAIFFAPSLILGPQTSWIAVDETSFDVALTDRGTTVRARVFLDERGAPIDFSTTDRYGEDPAKPGRMVQARWSTPMYGWREVDGRRLPTGGKAIWHFESGDMAYADFRIDGREVEFDVPP
jgi:hypothetical protein